MNNIIIPEKNIRKKNTRDKETRTRKKDER